MKSIIKGRLLLLIFVFSFLALFGFLSLEINKVSASGICTTDTWSPTNATVTWKKAGFPLNQTFNLTHVYKSGFTPYTFTTQNESCTTINGTHGETCQAVGLTESILGPQDPTFGYPCNPGGLVNITSPANKVDTLLPVCGPWDDTNKPTYVLSGSTDPAASGGSGQSGINVSGGSCTTSAGNFCNVNISDVAGNSTNCPSPTYNPAVPAVTASCSVSSPVASGVNPSITFTTNSSSNNCYVRNDNIAFGFSPQPGAGVSSSGTVYRPGVQPAGSHQGSIYCQNSANTANSGWQYCPYTVSAPAIPATPTGLTATASSCGTGTINVSWSASSGATSYTLRDGTTTIYTGVLRDTTNPFAHTGLVAGSSHSYTVLATNASGSSAYSSAVSRTAPAVCVAADACGNGSSSFPRLTEPTTNPTACNPGVYANSPADTTTLGAQAWNWSCGTVTSCSAPKFGCRITTDSNYSLPQYGPTGPNNNYGCAGTCANGGTNYSTCTPPAGMSGTLTTPSCTIASGFNSCTTTLSWNVTDPEVVGGSSVTSSYPVTGTVISPPVSTGTADVGTKTNVTVPYSSRIFFLYNNGKQVNTSAASATCATGTSWNGSSCVPAMTGTLTASNCTIVSGASSCNTSLTWTTTNPVATSAVTTPTNITVGTGLNGSTTYGVSSGDRTFYLYNNAQLLAQATATATCATGTTWDGSKCATNTPPPPSAAPVIEIWASPTSGTVNQVNPVIGWEVINAPTSCTASGDWSGPRAAGGTQEQGVLTSIKTSPPYTYTLTCSNAYGSDVESATVVVSGTASGVTISVNPTRIYYGGSATLTWSGPTGSTCTGTNFDNAGDKPGTTQAVNVSGNPSVGPKLTTTTTYTINCNGVTTSTTLKVIPKPIYIED